MNSLWNRAKQRYGQMVYRFIRRTFFFWERLGLHLTFNHYYEPVPDTRKLKESLWTTQSELVGININEERQLALLSTFAAMFRQEYEAFPVDKTPVPHAFYLKNSGYPSVDAEILWCMIRYFKPKRILEVGCGNSTYLSAQAVLVNAHDVPPHPCELIGIEPAPNPVVKAGFPGLTALIAQPLEQVPMSRFERLDADDILFIDSSHVLKIGSDVQYEYLEILPRLRKGVLVHVHDIHFPMEYPRNLVMESRRFWNEQYLLQAFLAFNDTFEVLWAGNFISVRHPEALEAAFKSYDRKGRWPSSCWLRRIR
jgi:hypothetical protein